MLRSLHRQHQLDSSDIMVQMGNKTAGKRKREVDDGAGQTDTKPTLGQQTSHIRNKLVRQETYAKLKSKQKKEKKVEQKKRQQEYAKAEALGLQPEKPTVRTIESTRQHDETLVDINDEETAAAAEQDEFADHFAREKRPLVLITTGYRPTKSSYKFVDDLLKVLPHAAYYKRRGYALKKITPWAAARGFTDMLVVHEDRKTVNDLLLVHLPGGPTAHFKLTNLRLNKEIKGHGRISSHKPELVLNNFDTQLGQRVGRLFASLFDQDPQFKGRRVVTFHNQRDFIFFRHHRYIFEEREKAVQGKKAKQKRVIARLQELGPRFTLKLLSLQKGTFDSKEGEYEFLRNSGTDSNWRAFKL